MKSRFVAFVGVFCIACLIVPSAYADKPDNPGKPDKPRVPGQTKPECIVFSDIPEGGNSHGFLEGGQDKPISGCCLNAGPWPEYTMTLTNMGPMSGTDVEGYLSITIASTGPNQKYMVEFWTWDVDDDNPLTPGNGDYFFEIRGGDIVRDRKNKVLTVTFDGEPATVWAYDDVLPRIPIPIPNVSFVLVRTSDLSYCGD